jgi:hypothetical protein
MRELSNQLLCASIGEQNFGFFQLKLWETFLPGFLPSSFFDENY